MPLTSLRAAGPPLAAAPDKGPRVDRSRGYADRSLIAQAQEEQR